MIERCFDTLFKLDKVSIDYFRSRLFKEEKSIHSYLLKTIQGKGYTHEESALYVLYSTWYYACCINRKLYFETDLWHKYIEAFFQDLSTEAAEQDVTISEELVFEIASVIHWKNMQRLANNSEIKITIYNKDTPNIPRIETIIWNDIVPHFTDLFSIFRYLEGIDSHDLKLFSTKDLQNMQDLKFDQKYSTILSRCTLRHCVRHYICSQLIQDTTLSYLVFESLEYFWKCNFGNNIDSAVPILSQIIYYLNTSDTSKLLELSDKYENECLTSLEHTQNFITMRANQFISFQKEWESWIGLQYFNITNDMKYTLAAIFSSANKKSSYYKYFSNLIQDENCIQYINDFQQFSLLYNNLNKEVLINYANRRKPKQTVWDYVGENDTYDQHEEPRCIKQMIAELSLPNVKTNMVVLIEPNCFNKDDIETFLATFDKYMNNASRLFEPHNFNTQSDKNSNIFIGWNKDWCQLSYLLRLLYVGIAKEDGSIDCSMSMPRGIWSTAAKIFINDKGEHPSEDTLKKITYAQHQRELYSITMNNLMHPILMKIKGRHRSKKEEDILLEQ